MDMDQFAAIVKQISGFVWDNLLLYLLPGMAVIRGSICLIRINEDAEQSGIYKRRLKNMLVFVAIAESSLSILTIVLGYFN